MVSGPRTLDRIQSFLNELWANHPDLPELLTMDVTVAASEIASNIIEHSAAGQQVRVRMEIRLMPERVEIDFTDDGDPVSVDLDQVCLPDDLADRGRGLAIAKAVLDELSYRRDTSGNTNHWTLTRRRFA